MRFLLLFFLFFLESISFVFAQKADISHLKFYNCDYSDTTSYQVVLSSGSTTETYEIWAVDKNLLDSLPSLSEMKLDLQEVTHNAKLYLESRYYSPNSNKNYILAEITFERITPKKDENKNWIIIAKFIYDERGFYQYVPILLDGRIILSNWLK